MHTHYSLIQFSSPNWFNKVQSHVRKEGVGLLMEWHRLHNRRKRKEKASQLLTNWCCWTTNAQASPQKVFQVVKNNVELFRNVSIFCHEDMCSFSNWKRMWTAICRKQTWIDSLSYPFQVATPILATQSPLPIWLIICLFIVCPLPISSSTSPQDYKHHNIRRIYLFCSPFCPQQLTDS